ncbi:mitochondrial membrane protein [Cladochytrium tenue]|nr:mitochondrial membrane protein [Cladochytrium tenue]
MDDASLPFAFEAEASLPDDELAALANAYHKEVEAGQLRAQTKFDYAWAQVRSRSKIDQERGVKLLMEVYRENPSRRRECLYYLAVGEYKLGHYREARNYNDSLLQMEPRNAQAVGLRKMVDDKVRTDGLVGMALVGGAVAAVGVVTALLFRKSGNEH